MIHRCDHLEISGKLSDQFITEQHIEILALAGQADVFPVEPVLLFGTFLRIPVPFVEIAVKRKDILSTVGFKSRLKAFVPLKNEPPVVLHCRRGRAVKAAAVVETVWRNTEIKPELCAAFVARTTEGVPYIIAENRFSLCIAGVAVQSGQLFRVAYQAAVYFHHCFGQTVHNLGKRFCYIFFVIFLMVVEPCFAVVHIVFKNKIKRLCRKGHLNSSYRISRVFLTVT